MDMNSKNLLQFTTDRRKTIILHNKKKLVL